MNRWFVDIFCFMPPPYSITVPGASSCRRDLRSSSLILRPDGECLTGGLLAPPPLCPFSSCSSIQAWVHPDALNTSAAPSAQSFFSSSNERGVPDLMFLDL